MLPFRIAAADLIIGASCGGCGSPAITLCESCSGLLTPRPHVAWPRPVPHELLEPTAVIPVASGAHEGVLRAALAQYKEEGQFGLVKVLGHFLAASLCLAAPEDVPVLLVPIPSTRVARLRRGRDPVAELARSCSKALRAIGLDCSVGQPLVHSRRVSDQSGLSARERSANMNGALRMRSTAGLDGRRIVIVDDVLTTGATVAEATRVLSSAGFRPSAVAVIAAAVRRI
ncbi:MAG: ComF family protein [Actinomycetota bacterium]|nr:ComF family protein [Actinomycetota bacterium]